MKYELNNYYNCDCLEAMKEMPDKFFDLAIVDPPYGGGASKDSEDTFKGAISGRFGGNFDKYKIKATRTGGTWNKKYYSEGENKTKTTHWDISPPQEYFDELFRVSKNQIIWGGNYFALPPTRCFCVWRKLTISESFSMAMCEYAWTSFNDNAKWIEIAPQGNKNESRFHPTQKPVALYTWLLNNYAKKGDKILDTHVGSASSLIACHKLGFDYIGFELDTDYYNQSKQRLESVKRQVSFFDLDNYESVFEAVSHKQELK